MKKKLQNQVSVYSYEIHIYKQYSPQTSYISDETMNHYAIYKSIKIYKKKEKCWGKRQ